MTSVLYIGAAGGMLQLHTHRAGKHELQAGVCAARGHQCCQLTTT